MNEIDQLFKEADEICKRIGARDYDHAIEILEKRKGIPYVTNN